MTYRTKECSEPQAEQIQRKPCLAISQPNHWKQKVRESLKRSQEKNIYITHKGTMIHTVLEQLDSHRQKKKKKEKITTWIPHVALSQPFLPLPVLHPINQQSVLYFHNFFISRMLYKWNHTYKKANHKWDWQFSFSRILWRFIQVVACIDSTFLLLLNSISWYRCITVCLTTRLLKDIWIISNFRLL